MARRPTILSLGDLGLDDVREAVDLREIVGAMQPSTSSGSAISPGTWGARVAALESGVHPLKLMTDLVQQQVKTVRDAHAAHDLPAAMTACKATRKSTPSAPRYFARPSDPLSAKNIASMASTPPTSRGERGAPYRVARLVGCRRRSTAG
jgi:hypothetical protein